MNIIVCVDDNWGIGKNNGLLFHLPKDLQYFKEKTLNKTIAMGGNTLLSFPKSKPLPNRKNIVLTDLFTRMDCTVVPTLDELFAVLMNEKSEDIYVVGGAMFYKTMLNYCDTAYVTKVNCVCDDATVFFPNLDKLNNWECVSESEVNIDNGYETRYTKYINKLPKPMI